MVWRAGTRAFPREFRWDGIPAEVVIRVNSAVCSAERADRDRRLSNPHNFIDVHRALL